MIKINLIGILFGGFCASLFFLADYIYYIDNSTADVVSAIDYQTLLLKTKKVILEKKGLIREISTLKGEIEILTNQNNEFILQGVKTLEVIKDKNLELAANMDLLDKYENAFVQFNKERKDMCEILDKYKENLQKLLD
jgi:hypothetical protein